MNQENKKGRYDMDYIWFDDKSSIINQLPRNFKSAAIILSPFIQMPSNWVSFKQKNWFEVKYPSEDSLSPLLIKDFLNVISSKGANNLYFSAPTQNKSGILQIKTTTTLL